MEKIAITGFKGTIGTVLQQGLKEYEVTPIDKPEHDVTVLGDLLPLLKGNSTVIHLAWDMTETAHNSGKSSKNLEMAKNVFEAALKDGVKRVIIASSVHADRYYKDWKEETLLPPSRENPKPEPDVPYGHTKLEIETMSGEYAKKGLDVVCIRFGGIYKPGQTPPEQHKHTWLSHNDAVSLIKTILEQKPVPGRLTIMYGVSMNKGKRIHDISNPFGWIPKDSI